MSRVLLVETSAQAEWICSHLPESERGTLVAVTAEARAQQGIPEAAEVKATVEYIKHEDPAHDENLQKS